jgi:hypothetical protein
MVWKNAYGNPVEGAPVLSLAYEATANELCRRIAALIPEHPEILTLESAWDLFKVPGFKCDDLQPSLAQASAALAFAQREYRETRRSP